MFHASFPQFLRSAMVSQFEADSRLELFELARPQLDVEVVTFVTDLKNLWPREAVDAESVGIMVILDGRTTCVLLHSILVVT